MVQASNPGMGALASSRLRPSFPGAEPPAWFPALQMILCGSWFGSPQRRQGFEYSGVTGNYSSQEIMVEES